MKIVALVGSNAENSINRKLLLFIKKHFSQYDIELAEIRDLPIFKEGEPAPDSVQLLADKIMSADAILIGAPEQQHSVPSALKSALEWFSSAVHPLENKPIFIVGTSPMPQGASRSHDRLKVILGAEGFNAWVFNRDQFNLGEAANAFDENGNIKDPNTVKFLEIYFNEVMDWYKQITK